MSNGTQSATSVEALPQLRKRFDSSAAAGLLFRTVLYGCLMFGIVALVTLVVYVSVEGIPKINVDFFTHFSSSIPALAGIQSAIVGTIYCIGLVLLIAVPLGVGGAIYLEEFANKDRWFNRVIEVNIQNLAAVPSIVFGILGLAVIARGIDFGIGTLMSGAVTLTLLVLPTVIISAREAIKTVAPSMKEGALALGATEVQATARIVLPASIPGIATGSILALSRAIGETAPLLMLAVPVFLPQNPAGLFDQFTSLPVLIYSWTSEAQTEFKQLAAAAIIVLLVILLLMNSIAIFIRNRHQKKWKH